VPYDSHDSHFLNEIKVSAAEYQTHSLAIANSHYDKDAASEAKLRVLVDFCDSYAQWSGVGVGDGKSAAVAASTDDNLDSDDDAADADMPPVLSSAAPAPASSPVPASSSSAVEFKEVKQAGGAAAGSSSSYSSSSAAVESKAARQAAEVKRGPRPRRHRRRQDSSSGSSSASSSASSSSSDSESCESSAASDSEDNDDEDAETRCAAVQDDAEYLPDRIIAKKTVGWRDFYLIHWLGYTAAERTWEPAAFFDEYCTKQTHDYEQARRPLRILSVKEPPASPGESKEAKPPACFEVQWRGRPASETSMEREEWMRDAHADLVKEWEQRETADAARKRKSLPAQELAAPHSKRRRTASGAVPSA
jgi:hypothetical protein